MNHASKLNGTRRHDRIVVLALLALVGGAACAASGGAKEDGATGTGSGRQDGGGTAGAGGRGQDASPDGAGGAGGMAARDAGVDTSPDGARGGQGGGAPADAAPDTAAPDRSPDVTQPTPDVAPDSYDTVLPTPDSAPPTTDAPAGTADAPADAPVDMAAQQPDTAPPAPDLPPPSPDLPPPLTLGAACSGDSRCESGHCTDGVCCDEGAATCGGCRSCNVAGEVGHCANVPRGQDPHNACNLDIYACKDFDCRGDGTCNREPGTQCLGSTCAANREFVGVCTTGGRCLTVSRDCPQGAACAGGKCATSCRSQRDCDKGFYCEVWNEGSPNFLTCQPRRPIGDTCNEERDEVCQSGNCETGQNDMRCACSDESCRCQECTYINTAGTACIPDEGNFTPDHPSEPGQCCHVGACVLGACTGASESTHWSSDCGMD